MKNEKWTVIPKSQYVNSKPTFYDVKSYIWQKSDNADIIMIYRSKPYICDKGLIIQN